jgi:hypothetical protein
MSSPRNRWLRVVSLLFAAAPLSFGVIRAVRTGSDLRYVWVALGALVGATAVTAVGRAYGASRQGAVVLSAAVFVIASLIAVLVALLLGTNLGPGIAVVAAAFGFCYGVSCLLQAIARPRGL